MEQKNNTILILGIPFFNSTLANLLGHLNDNGGLMVVPSAPVLASVTEDKETYKALIESDIAIADSGLMVLLWNIISNPKIKKLSGFAFIDFFLNNISLVEKKRILSIDPTNADSQENQNLFLYSGVPQENIISYTAPMYGGMSISDTVLLKMIKNEKPDWIFINIGGGTQERLGLYIRKNISYCPAIICTGAAIAFKTGRQVAIPTWIDKYYLGWLARCISNPKQYIPRYAKSVKLIRLLLKFESEKVN
jgi:UDP-N-acetyl-D-mannosaminuronic acid transferase (WecB/TagA/CpsF family)